MTFDEHTNGQLRIGAQGDQIPLLALPAEEIPESDGPELAAEGLTRAQADREARELLTYRRNVAELERHAQWER